MVFLHIQQYFWLPPCGHLIAKFEFLTEMTYYQVNSSQLRGIHTVLEPCIQQCYKSMLNIFYTHLKMCIKSLLHTNTRMQCKVTQHKSTREQHDPKQPHSCSDLLLVNEYIPTTDLSLWVGRRNILLTSWLLLTQFVMIGSQKVQHIVMHGE